MPDFSRSEFNKTILNKSLEKLKSRDTSAKYEGVVLAAYLMGNQTSKLIFISIISPMRLWLWTGLVATVIGVLWLVVFFTNSRGEIISPVEAMTPMSTQEVTPTATPSATTTPTRVASISAKPKKATSTPKPTPTMAASEEVYRLIEKYSPTYGMDPNVVRHMAICESGFRSNAVNGKYVGLFQFDAVSWQNTRAEMGKDPNPELRFSAEESIQTALYALSKGRSKMWPNCVP